MDKTTGSFYYGVPNVGSDYVTSTELTEILRLFDVTKVYWFTYVDGYYGSYASPPTNDDVQVWTIPTGFPVGTVIRVHCWGAGSVDDVVGTPSVGGYSYGEMTIVDVGDFIDADPSLVYEGMELCVHVGNPSGRAAVWRKDTSLVNYNSLIKEMIVAGGAGGRGHSYLGGPGGGTSGQTGYGGSTIWTIVTGGTGGSQVSPGTGGSATGLGETVCQTQGLPGYRVWGCPTKVVCTISGGGGALSGLGGDGFYGGGGGSSAAGVAWGEEGGAAGSGGGGGSGYSALDNGFTETNIGDAITPPHSDEPAWGLNAGLSGSPGRVAFEIVPTL